MTTRATTPMTMSSENPTSNMDQGTRREARETSASLLFLHFAFDRGARGGDRRGARLVFLAALHAVLEALHSTAEIGADVAQLLRAEDEQHDHEDDDPVPDAERTHAIL